MLTTMWVLVLAASLLTAYYVPTRALPALDLDTVSELLSELEQLPVEDVEDDDVSPELADLYHHVELLAEIQASNLTETREGKGLLSKLSFLTGMRLGSFLTSSGTLAASQSVNFLGKVLNAALSISYGDIGGYPGIIPGGGVPLETPVVGLQKLPVIQEDLPVEDKMRERPSNEPVSSSSTPTASAVKVNTPEGVRREFIKDHNQRVEDFNAAFDKKRGKTRGRTGRVERQVLNNPP